MATPKPPQPRQKLRRSVTARKSLRHGDVDAENPAFTSMRQIGSLSGEAQARLFADFLHARGIRSEIEAEADRTWSVWIRDDDQIPEAQSSLARYQANPNAPEF